MEEIREQTIKEAKEVYDWAHEPFPHNPYKHRWYDIEVPKVNVYKTKKEMLDDIKIKIKGDRTIFTNAFDVWVFCGTCPDFLRIKLGKALGMNVKFYEEKKFVIHGLMYRDRLVHVMDSITHLSLEERRVIYEEKQDKKIRCAVKDIREIYRMGVGDIDEQLIKLVRQSHYDLNDLWERRCSDSVTPERTL